MSATDAEIDFIGGVMDLSQLACKDECCSGVSGLGRVALLL